MTVDLGRRTLVLGGALLGALPAARAAIGADRPIELLVSFSAGGTADALARLISQKLLERRKWNVLVVNRPGAGGILMQRALKTAKPDGYTIGLGGSGELTYPATESTETPYALKDFAALASIADFPHCLVGRPNAGLETLAQWRDHAKNKGSLSIGFSPPYERAVARIGADLGLNIVPVPFKGGAEMAQQVIAGNLDLSWSAGAHVPLEKAGMLKVCLALTPHRLPGYPQVPTAKEFGSTVAIESRFIVFGASELPATVKAEWEAVLAEVMNDPASRAAIAGRGLIAEFRSGRPLVEALTVEADSARSLLR